MAEINLSSYETTNPRIYAFITTNMPDNIGWLKIGYTSTQTVEERVKQQTYHARAKTKIEWIELAPYCNGKFLIDVDFHKFLEKKYKIPRDEEGREWFKISPALAKKYFQEFKRGNSTQKLPEIISESYNLRDEQINAVEMTLDYFLAEKASPEFLWNAKPRFGKNLSVYELIKKIGAKKILIVTNRPSISDSWYGDFEKFTRQNGGNYKFIIHKKNSLLKNATVYSRAESLSLFDAENPTEIFFISLQDLKGSKYFGGDTNKLDWLLKINFDLLVVDESHEGVDTDKTYAAFKNLRRKFTLYLSGTPFKALANNKFKVAQIFNWSYADEQNAKNYWYEKFDTPNPYADLPRMNLYSYRLDKMIDAEFSSDFTCDLNAFFETDGKGKFLHENEIKKFLDALTTQEKFPFSTEKLREELKHTFWLMYRVDGVKAMAKLLQEHKIFKDYQIIIAAGDGKIDESDEKQNEKSLSKVKAAVANSAKTITLSVGQLTTGVTVPEWTAVLMLSSFKSAALYFQAAFRAQTPHRYETDTEIFHKTNCYVFDFDPVRALEIYNNYAANLGGSGGKIPVENLLKLFPVFAENDAGHMVELDAEKIMSLPQKIAASQVVDCRFMNNALFKNIDRVFNNSAVKKIIYKIRSGDSNKTETFKPGGETPPPPPNPPRPKLPPNATVTEIVKNLENDGYKLTAALKRKISELVKQNVDAEKIQEIIIAEIDARQTENDFRAKLRSFAATIPSFIMAYGDDNLTLENFDTYIDDTTFEQVTGITLAEFKTLRDEELFNEEIFNAAVTEFLARMEQYADYFDETLDKDIFDFIPPQKNSQVFTPRFIVQEMVDALEVENPNIFDSPAQIFFDPYIKSGLYLAEIVKRLYRNKNICAAFPNDAARLKHILENQVFGCAPNEIIFRIATRYIFGNRADISQKNFHKIDTLASLRDGNISVVLKKIFSVKVIILNKDRVKKFGEVFTPPEIVKEMLAYNDIQAEIKNLHSRFFEPATGEAAFLCEILRQKLNYHVKAVDAAGDFKYKMLWIVSGLYGVEIQEDNVTIAKNNLIEIFCEHYQKICGFPLNEKSDLYLAMKELLQWSIIKGDALNQTNSTRLRFAVFEQFDDLHLAQCKICTYDKFLENQDPQNLFKPEFSVTKPFDLLNVHCTEFKESEIVDIDQEFKSIVVIGNPPYQGETSGDNKTFAKPVYHLFLQSFWQACNRVMMIHPARCLFNAGATPKDFMKKLLDDQHLKVILYEPNSKKIFPNADIKGGVAVTYRNQNISFGKIEVFIPFVELKSIWQKVFHRKDFKSLNEIMHGQMIYRLSEKAYEDFPDLPERLPNRTDTALRTNAFEVMPDIFLENLPNDEYFTILGLFENVRVKRYVRQIYMDKVKDLYTYKIFIPAANGSGSIGEKLSTPLVGLPLVGLPLVGSTQTYISIYGLRNAAEAANCLKYIKTKFARALLGVLKITQHNPPEKWKYVPLQDFSGASDIDWSRSIQEIDLQLYKKYNLSAEEINFIESKVKAM